MEVPGFSQRHKEAFCLMVYLCEVCMYSETIWNSRDGVTPFMMSCLQPNCRGMMQHQLFGADREANFPMPYVKHLWVDITREDAHTIATKQFSTLPDVVKQQHPDLTIQVMVDSICGTKGQPFLVTIEEYKNRARCSVSGRYG